MTAWSDVANCPKHKRGHNTLKTDPAFAVLSLQIGQLLAAHEIVLKELVR